MTREELAYGFSAEGCGFCSLARWLNLNHSLQSPDRFVSGTVDKYIGGKYDSLIILLTNGGTPSVGWRATQL